MPKVRSTKGDDPKKLCIGEQTSMEVSDDEVPSTSKEFNPKYDFDYHEDESNFPAVDMEAVRDEHFDHVDAYLEGKVSNAINVINRSKRLNIALKKLRDLVEAHYYKTGKLPENRHYPIGQTKIVLFDPEPNDFTKNRFMALVHQYLFENRQDGMESFASPLIVKLRWDDLPEYIKKWRFQDHYSKLTAQFQKQLSAKNKWTWGADQDKIFEQIKEKFLDTVMLLSLIHI